MTAAIPVTTRRFGPSGSWKNANIILEHTTAVIARISKELFLKLTCMRVWPRLRMIRSYRSRGYRSLSSSLRRSGYGCALMSPRPSLSATSDRRTHGRCATPHLRVHACRVAPAAVRGGAAGGAIMADTARQVHPDARAGQRSRYRRALAGGPADQEMGPADRRREPARRR